MFSTLNSKGNCFPNCAPGITHDTRSCGFPPTSFFIASSYGFGMPQDPPTSSFYRECNILETPCRGPFLLCCKDTTDLRPEVFQKDFCFLCDSGEKVIMQA